jgi:hypothetical protein
MSHRKAQVVKRSRSRQCGSEPQYFAIPVYVAMQYTSEGEACRDEAASSNREAVQNRVSVQDQNPLDAHGGRPGQYLCNPGVRDQGC